MENKSVSKPLIMGLSLILGLFLLGFFIFKGFKTFSDKDRVVTVRGLAEMNITAISASIDLGFSFSGDNLQEIIKQAENKRNSIIDYLKSSGFDEKEISITKANVTDREKYFDFRLKGDKEVQYKINRYTVSLFIVIKSKEIKSSEDIASKIKFDLVSKNLTANVNTSYEFPDLNSIKPKLIAESTKNARIAGEQFANDSQSKLGKIKTATQGQISIVGQINNYSAYNSEENETSEVSVKPKESYLQKVRVVSSIVFFLE
ncbi:MAG: SIMPL domain-containing protein [Candidatus Kapabacteria bacterium]|nr:SIMPL domain-containing protein [Candidatus Kapabacteria bacterium]